MTARSALRWIAYFLLSIATVLLVAILAIRFLLFPNIHQYKDAIASYASNTIQRKITIGDIQTGWRHISPRVTLVDVIIDDEQSRPALTLQKVETELSWLSLGLLDLRLSELTVRSPQLMVRRSTTGFFYLAGVNLSGRGNPDFTNWLLAQSKVSVTNASVTYIDENRNAPPLSLQSLNLSLSNSDWKSLFGRHEFQLTAMPSMGSPKPIHISGYFIGRDISNLKDWRGNIHTSLQKTDLAVWRPWFDYPFNLQGGTGDAEADFHFSKLAFDGIDAKLKLQDVNIIHPTSNQPLIAKKLNGNLSWKHTDADQTIAFKQFYLTLNTGLNIEDANGEWVRKSKNNQPWIEGYVSVQSMQLAQVANSASHLPLPAVWQEWIHGISPSGNIQSLKTAISGHPEHLQHYTASAEFSAFEILPYQQIPGFTNLSGKANLNEHQGQIQLDTRNATLDLKNILRWPVPITTMNGVVEWKTNAKSIQVQVNKLKVKNPHIAGIVEAKYEHAQNKGGYLDLNAKFDEGNVKFASFYYPTILGKDTLHWLDTSILAGQANDVNVVIKGKLADFPFVNQNNQPDPKLGQFKVTALIEDASIEYGKDWPLIRGLSTQMLFEGKRMLLKANKGFLFNNKIQSSLIEIPQLDADWPMLRIVSEVDGPIREGIRFVNESPVKQVTMGFTETLKTMGDAHLHLELNIPLQNVESATYSGAYQMKNATLLANHEIGLPELSKINGTINFNESGLTAQNISTEILGGSSRLTLSTSKDKTIQINANGRIHDTGIKKLFNHPLSNALQGTTDWKADITVKKSLADLTFTSNLVGMSVNLPSPFQKTAAQIMPLKIEKKQQRMEEDEIHLQYSDLVSGKILRHQINGHLEIERGEIGIYTQTAIPNTKGIALKAKFETLDIDPWLAYFKQPSTHSQLGNVTMPSLINQAELSAKTLTLLNRQIHQLKATANPSPTGLKLAIQSKELTGDVLWQGDEKSEGKITAKLKNLMIPMSKEKSEPSSKKEIKRLSKKYPALEMEVDNFEIGDKKFGALSVNAFESGDTWEIQRLNMTNPDFVLIADGTWHNWTQSPNTALKFNLQASNIGKALKRFGQTEAVKGGKATITGELRWPGSPHEFDTSGLNGNFKLNAEKGQVVKVQPGVGRLFGLLSLQSLPRRLSLDFKDLFSEGFAFDKISATAISNNGILKSNDFFMTGPSAEAKIQGETNLKTETQTLRVTVVPHVTDSLSLAALAGGPIIGAAAFVAQKILKDPFNKIASTEYVITGTWDNPQEVESKKEMPNKQRDSIDKN